MPFGVSASPATKDATLAPRFAIKVQGADITPNIVRYIQSIEYESSMYMADAAHISFTNPGNIISDAKAFQPGNDLSIYIGYKDPLTYIGTVLSRKHRPIWPRGGAPTLSITGYSKDILMTENAPTKSDKRTFKDATYSDIVSAVAGEYKFELDIDATDNAPKGIIQKTGTTDFEFVQSIANATGYWWWVDCDETGAWTLHFKKPDAAGLQEKIYSFRYNNGEMTSLLSFRPELIEIGSKVKIEVISKDRKTGKIIKAEVEETNNNAPDMDATSEPTEKVQGEYTSGSDVKLHFGEFSFESVADKRFQNEADVIAWAKQWFRRQREHFISAEGEVIGLETLMARQKHSVLGISFAYSGMYRFTNVRHNINDSDGYMCTFNATKVIPE